jgi:tellurite resistance protein TerC
MQTIPENALLWAGFVVFIILMLVLDLVIFNKKTHEIKMKEALLTSLFWISLAIIFNLGVWKFLGPQKALEFLAAYLIEESLSIDNSEICSPIVEQMKEWLSIKNLGVKILISFLC